MSDMAEAPRERSDGPGSAERSTRQVSENVLEEWVTPDALRATRRVRNVLEPIAATVYFAPEAHRAFGALGLPQPEGADRGQFAPLDPGVYMLARSACLGDVPIGVVTAAFAIFPHAVVQQSLSRWRPRVSLANIQRARCDAAVAALGRQIGPVTDRTQRAAALARRAAKALPIEGRPVFAALRDIPFRYDDPLFDLWHAADLYREHRGDSHIAAWTSAGLSPPQACLINDLSQGLGLKTYVRTRGWDNIELENAVEALKARGLIEDGQLSMAGQRLRERIETATDRSQVAAVAALGDDLDELYDLVDPYRRAIVAANGYPGRSALAKLRRWQTASEK